MAPDGLLNLLSLIKESYICNAVKFLSRPKHLCLITGIGDGES